MRPGRIGSIGTKERQIARSASFAFGENRQRANLVGFAQIEGSETVGVLLYLADNLYMEGGDPHVNQSIRATVTIIGNE